MKNTKIGNIPVVPKSGTLFPRLSDVTQLKEFTQFEIRAGRIAAEINQCPKCTHCCRDTSGKVWKLVAKPKEVRVIAVSRNNTTADQQLQYDSRYSTFCSIGTDISPVQGIFNATRNQACQIIPAAGIGKDPKKEFKCQLGKFQKIEE